MNDHVTAILQAVNRGESDAAEQLLSVVYGELRKLATAKLAHERPGNTLQASDLVNEAYLRLFNDTPQPSESDSTQSDLSSDGPAEPASQWHSRRHFFAAAAEAMRRILIDRARARNALKRGGDRDRVDFEYLEVESDTPSVDMLALDEALQRLEQHDQRKAEIVKLRYFAGLTIEQTAQALEVSEPTVKRHWTYSKAWLQREMAGIDSAEG